MGFRKCDQTGTKGGRRHDMSLRECDDLERLEVCSAPKNSRRERDTDGRRRDVNRHPFKGRQHQLKGLTAALTDAASGKSLQKGGYLHHTDLRPLYLPSR